jgi:hypothetical protein
VERILFMVVAAGRPGKYFGGVHANFVQKPVPAVAGRGAQA